MTGVHITVTDQNNPTNTGTELSIISGEGFAGGVGVQIGKRDDADALVTFGPDTHGIGGRGQWKAGDVATGTLSFQIPLSARYKQTGSITPGIAKAMATFTMAYD